MPQSLAIRLGQRSDRTVRRERLRAVEADRAGTALRPAVGAAVARSVREGRDGREAAGVRRAPARAVMQNLLLCQAASALTRRKSRRRDDHADRTRLVHTTSAMSR